MGALVSNSTARMVVTNVDLRGLRAALVDASPELAHALANFTGATTRFCSRALVVRAPCLQPRPPRRPGSFTRASHCPRALASHGSARAQTQSQRCLRCIVGTEGRTLSDIYCQRVWYTTLATATTPEHNSRQPQWKGNAQSARERWQSNRWLCFIGQLSPDDRWTK